MKQPFRLEPSAAFLAIILPLLALCAAQQVKLTAPQLSASKAPAASSAGAVTAPPFEYHGD